MPMLRWRHMTIFPQGHEARFLGRLGIALGHILLSRGSSDEGESALDSTTWKFEQELREGMPESVLAKIGEPMGKPDTQTETAAALAADCSREDKENKKSWVSSDEQGNAVKATNDASSADDPSIQVVPWTSTHLQVDAALEAFRSYVFHSLYEAARALGADKNEKIFGRKGIRLGSQP